MLEEICDWFLHFLHFILWTWFWGSAIKGRPHLNTLIEETSLAHLFWDPEPTNGGWGLLLHNLLSLPGKDLSTVPYRESKEMVDKGTKAIQWKIYTLCNKQEMLAIICAWSPKTPYGHKNGVVLLLSTICSFLNVEETWQTPSLFHSFPSSGPVTSLVVFFPALHWNILEAQWLCGLDDIKMAAKPSSVQELLHQVLTLRYRVFIN